MGPKRPRFADVQLDAVWGTGPNDVYAAGQQWSLFTLPSTADREPLDIWGTSPPFKTCMLLGSFTARPTPKIPQ